MQFTAAMETLLATPDDQRDQNWEDRLLAKLLSGKVNLVDDKAISGPDGFPYFLVDTRGVNDVQTETQSESQAEPVAKIIDWLGKKGIGLVVNAHREPYPDLVLTYGMIWSLHRFGSTEIPTENYPKDFQAGEPTDEVIPDSVRKMIKQFFVDNGVLSLRFLLISRVEGLELCFSLESLGSPPEKERGGVAEAISWFLPTNVGVSIASEKDLKGFVAV